MAALPLRLRLFRPPPASPARCSRTHERVLQGPRNPCRLLVIWKGDYFCCSAAHPQIMPGNCALEEWSNPEKDRFPALLLHLHGPPSSVSTCACAHVQAKSHEESSLMSKVRGRVEAAANQVHCVHVHGREYGPKCCLFPIIACFEFGSNSSVKVRRKVDWTALPLIPLTMLSCINTSALL